MVQLENIGVAFRGEYLFRNLTWHIADGERVGLVGPNGAGKTTLFRVISGQLMPDEGRLTMTKGTTFGYLPQEEVTMEGRTLYEEALSALSGVVGLRAEQERIEKRLRIGGHDPDAVELLLKKYGDLQEEFEKRDGYSVKAEVESVLSGLGFRESDFARRTEEFSGGWQMRTALAKLLLEKPNVLLLDEPTNHLDLESMTWLEDYLESYEGTVVTVSHDRYFMDRVAGSTAELDSGKLTRFPMNYTAYLAEKERRRESLLAAQKHQKERIEQLEKFIERFKAKASKAAQARSKSKILQKMERIEIADTKRSFAFQFPPVPRCARRALELIDAGKSYGSAEVLSGVDLIVERDDRIAVVGVNGAGKSTLLRVLAGVEPLSSGERKLGGKVRIQYFSQRTSEMLSPDRTVLEEVQSVAPDRLTQDLRGLLGSFLFSGELVHKRVGVLSGGEKCRLALAKIMLIPANLLLLDEPTNHLDENGRAVFEEALAQYNGAFIIVSHDRYLVDRLARKVLRVKNMGIREYLGNYTDYLLKSKQEDEGVIEEPKTVSRRSQRAERKELKRRQAARRQKIYEKRKALKKVEVEIEDLEEKVRIIEETLSRSETYKDEERVKDLVYEDRELRERLELLYKKLEEALAQLENQKRSAP
jgi:ATP-binding cassette subfamily F protein 3